MLQKTQVKRSLYCTVLLSHHTMATAASYYILLCPLTHIHSDLCSACHVIRVLNNQVSVL